MCRANSKSTPAQRLDGRVQNPAKFLFRTSQGRFDLQSDREGSSNKKRPSHFASAAAKLFFKHRKVNVTTRRSSQRHPSPDHPDEKPRVPRLIASAARTDFVLIGSWYSMHNSLLARAGSPFAAGRGTARMLARNPHL
ncbi:hypothetical protein E4U54_007429 [Claviceps lovelessii]|nr:hypothetical protein E4U54_007429 [Claviceps lovelessii]